MADCLAHVAHLTVPPLVDRQGDPVADPGRPHSAGPRRRGHAVADLHSGGQVVDRVEAPTPGGRKVVTRSSLEKNKED